MGRPGMGYRVVPRRDSSCCLSIGARERIGAHLVGASSERVPIGPACPDAFAGSLRPGAQCREINPHDTAAFDPYNAVDYDRVDIVADPTFDEAFDRVAHWSHPQAAAAGEVDDNDVGLGPREPAEIVASER